MRQLFVLLKRFFSSEIIRMISGFLLFLMGAALVMLKFEAADRGFDSFWKALWFSWVSITTVGYGDMYPVTWMGQLSAMVIIFMGIGYAGVLTGYITTWLVERNRKRQLGQYPLKNLEGKFLVCGWKSDMGNLLKDILRLHGKNSDYLVLLNNNNPTEVMELKNDPMLEDLYFYRGDFTVVEHLENACAGKAEKVLVLADNTPGRSLEEIDFQTVLGAYAMDRIDPRIYMISELMLPKFRDYIQQAKVEEIVLSRYNGLAMLSNICLMSGVYSLYQKLFAVQDPLLEIVRIEDKWIGKTWREFKQAEGNRVVMGVLENVGNLTKRKAEKLGEAEKRPDYQDSVKTMHQIKNMVSNKPILHPGPDYVIRRKSAAIFIKVAPHRLNQDGEVKSGEHAPFRIISHHLEQALEQAQNWEQYCQRLQHFHIAPYEVDGQIEGISHKGKLYPFELIEISQDLRTLLVDVFAQFLRLPEASSNLAFATPREFLDRENAPKSKGELRQDQLGPLVILGWKDEIIEMVQFLMIQQCIQPKHEWKGIVVVADIDEKKEKRFQRHFGHYTDVSLVVGDSSTRSVLRTARVEQAAKVLVLAESGNHKSFQEIDAQTVLSCMLVEELNHRAYVVAELVDKRYENTLRQAHVEEVLSMDEFSRELLANASHAKGMTNVFKEMFSIHHTVLRFEEVPESYVGHPYKDLYEDHSEPGVIILGLLEEAGNMFIRKTQMIRQAQFASNIKDSLRQLTKVKDVESNRVHLSPDSEYLVPPFATLMVLQSTDHEGWAQYTKD